MSYQENMETPDSYMRLKVIIKPQCSCDEHCEPIETDLWQLMDDAKKYHEGDLEQSILQMIEDLSSFKCDVCSFDPDEMRS